MSESGGEPEPETQQIRRCLPDLGPDLVCPLAQKKQEWHFVKLSKFLILSKNHYVYNINKIGYINVLLIFTDLFFLSQRFLPVRGHESVSAEDES